MQNEINTPQSLLGPTGSLTSPGWARHPYWSYSRSRIQARALRIKEWDYYAVLTSHYGITITVSDLGYIGFVAMTVLDFKQGREVSDSLMTILPLGRLGLPASSEEGDVVFKNSKVDIQFLHRGQARILKFEWQDFQDKQTLRGEIQLTTQAQDESMNIATPFLQAPHAFYYNRKVNCMHASGGFYLGSRNFQFDADTDFGVLDWGRGVWTYNNTWYWASASGLVAGKRFGINLGYGFGDTKSASENLLLWDGVAHKLDQIEFHIPEPDYLSPWKFTSNDERLALDFSPIVDRYSNTNLGLIQSWQHQVFGEFTGQVILDSGEVLNIENLIGFAEKVKNRW